MKKINAFDIERKRQKYSKLKKFKELQKLYKVSLPEIINNNSPALWDLVNSTFTGFPMENDRTKIVSRLIKEVKPRSILNIGFGSANLEKILLDKNNNYKWVGVDISQKSVNNAKSQFKSGTFNKGNITNLKYKNNTFDLVAAQEVLEHISPSQIFTSLAEVYRVLKKGGYFIVSVPLNEDLETMVNNGTNHNAHVRMYTVDLIKAELQISSFTIIKSELLFAFNDHYYMKKQIAKYIPIWKKPNNLIILAQKK